MTTNLDAGSELFLANLDRIQQGLATTNRQISSGKKISVASDAPDQIGTLLQLRADLQHNSQVQTNLILAKTDAASADSALGSAINLLDQAMTLGEQGANTTQTAGIRKTLSNQIQSIQEQIVAVTRTSVQGRYLFNVDHPNTAPYSFDNTLLAANPAVQMSPSTASLRVEDPAGGSFLAAKGAVEVFDSPAPNGPLTVLNNLRLALIANDPTAIAAAIDPIKQASAHLNSMQAFYGQVETRIQSAADYASNRDTQLQAQISQTQDTDITAAALQLTQGSVQLQAAMQMRAKLPHNSLFDYLG